MDLTLVWKGESIVLRALDRSTFLQVAMTFLSVCLLDYLFLTCIETPQGTLPRKSQKTPFFA